MSKHDCILCFGEILWDIFPGGSQHLGGAPANVAAHLTRIGCPSALLSAVGQDELGPRARQLMRDAGVDVQFLGTHPALPTGTVTVTTDSVGNATYTIAEPTAWDEIHLPDPLPGCRAVVYGSLAARSPHNRRVLDLLFSGLASRQTTLLMDVNLRPPHDDPALVRSLASHASILKLNHQELAQLNAEEPAADNIQPDRDKLCALARRLARETDTPLISITMGAHGAALYLADQDALHTVPAPKVEVKDTVGAGDAFTAAFLAGWLDGLDPETVLEKAVWLGTFVASRDGAIPDYDPNAI